MANTLTEVIPKLLAQGLLALRQQAIMPRLVNRGYEVMAGQKGSTVDIPIPSAVTVQDVTPAATPPSTADVAPTRVSIALSSWKEAPFYLTDKDMLESMMGTIPMQASEAVKAIANQLDADIMALYKDVYGFAGTAATTPFATDVSAYTAGARKILNQQLAPMDDRRVVLDPAAEANALGLRAFQDASFRADTAGIINGQIGTKLGADWFMDQNVVSHVAGTNNQAYLINNGAGYPTGTKTVTTDTGTGTILAGDILSFSGVTGTYVVVSTVGGGTVTSITFEPGLAGAVVDNATITGKASHVVNLAFHRDFAALAMRPFEGADPLGLGIFKSAIDPVSGLVLRLEVSREHKRTRFSYDVLYGVKTVRAALACRIAG